MTLGGLSIGLIPGKPQRGTVVSGKTTHARSLAEQCDGRQSRYGWPVLALILDCLIVVKMPTLFLGGARVEVAAVQIDEFQGLCKCARQPEEGPRL